jgi:hypothetical protein
VSRDRLDPTGARARAVADAPAEALVARSEELAHRWALTLLAARPLVEMAAIPLEDLARYAPALCAALARALSSDEELAIFELVDVREREDRPGALAATAGLSALAAGWEAPAAVEHVEALRGLLWQAALEELRDPTTRQVADLSDRLASVCAAALAYALAARSEAVRADAARPAFPPAREQVLYSAPAPSPGAPGAVLIDERNDAPRHARPRTAWRRGDGPTAPASGREQEQPSPHGAHGQSASPAAPRPLPWDTPLQSAQEPGTDPGGRALDDSAMRVSRGPGTPADRRS